MTFIHGQRDGFTELEVREVAHEVGRCRDCGTHMVGPHASTKDPLDKFGRCEDCAWEVLDQLSRCNFGYTPGEDDLPEPGAFPGEMYRA